jgi:hypothetical protein
LERIPMTAPVATARQAPTGKRLRNGYKVLWTFARSPAASLWEISGTPSGWEGGDEIDTTTFHNTTVKTKSPSELYESTNGSGTAAYDPTYLNAIRELINVEDTVTARLPDGTTIAAYGYLKNFLPQEHVDGEMPEANFEIVITNTDSAGNEELPVIVGVTGT